MTVEFFMPMIPPTVTHQEKQVRVVSGKPRLYEPAELKAARAKLVAHLGKYRPAAPIRRPVPIWLEVEWRFPLVRGAVDGQYKATRPDTDNLEKLLKDCMTAVGFWDDDAQVCVEFVAKTYSKTPGIHIRVTELGTMEATEDP